MIDFAKKIRKSCAGDLLQGEEVHAATFVQPSGAIRRQVAFGAIGHVAGAGIAALATRGSADAGDSPPEGMSIDIPKGKAVLGITDQRFLVFGHSTMSGKPKGLNAAFPLEQIQSLKLDEGKMTGKLVVTFVDETNIEFDVVKTGKPGPFVEAFHAVTGR